MAHYEEFPFAVDSVTATNCSIEASLAYEQFRSGLFDLHIWSLNNGRMLDIPLVKDLQEVPNIDEYIKSLELATGEKYFPIEYQGFLEHEHAMRILIQRAFGRLSLK